MRLNARASIEISRPAEAVYDVAVDPAKLPALLKKKGPIPGVVSVEMEGGAAPGAGATRSLKLSDGSTMREEIEVLDRPKVYAYRWLSRPPAPFSLLVKGADTEWSFKPSPAGTTVDWSYRLELTTPLVYPLAVPVAWLFRAWMQAGLEKLRAAVG